eukprot:3237912-Prymnesium_polylepis.1
MAGPKDRIAEDTHEDQDATPEDDEDKERSPAPGKPGSPTQTARNKTRTRIGRHEQQGQGTALIR